MGFNHMTGFHGDVRDTGIVHGAVSFLF
jgi:hypothetical protein